MNREQFIATLLPHAMEASRATGVDPRIIIAQGALESNWGKSAPGNNYFGIKSHGKGGGNTLSTTEVVNGQPVRIRDSFRSYADPGDSVRGYADFINTNPRYRDFKSAQGLDAQIDALGRSGYATDPQYSAKIASIARGIPAGSALPQGPDGPKGQESYKPVFGGVPTMPAGAPPSASPSPTPIPAAVQQAAAPKTKRESANDIFGMLAMAQDQGPQFSPVQIAGPSADQAQGLSQLVQALRSRVI
jgi:hypothetical protein